VPEVPLTYLLYRCPRCGHDPLEGEKDEALCSACGTWFGRGREEGRIRIREESGSAWEVPSGLLTAAIQALGGPGPRARDRLGGLRYETEVDVRIAMEEAPVRFRGELLGFAETLGPGTSGVLEITDEALTFSAPGEGGRQWPLLDIRAVQTSSSSLQISPREGGLIQFRFRMDSPRRWEELLHLALREAYRRAGLGEITEFQPRIVTSP
jgi:ribosomal protein L37E